MPENPTLATFYKGWEDYQDLLAKAIAPLSAEQLALRAAPNLRSIGEIATHIVRTRAGWFYNAIGEGSADIAQIAQWPWEGGPVRTAAELVNGLETTWQFIRDALARWTPAEMEQPFQRQRGGQEHTLTRQWIIWHLIEHDLHHGGELSYSLGMHGLAAPEL